MLAYAVIIQHKYGHPEIEGVFQDRTQALACRQQLVNRFKEQGHRVVEREGKHLAATWESIHRWAVDVHVIATEVK